MMLHIVAIGYRIALGLLTLGAGAVATGTPQSTPMPRAQYASASPGTMIGPFGPITLGPFAPNQFLKPVTSSLTGLGPFVSRLAQSSAQGNVSTLSRSLVVILPWRDPCVRIGTLHNC